MKCMRTNYAAEESWWAAQVRGPGVVGKQPVLNVGESFEYGSQAMLKDLKGSMHGSYQMLGIVSKRLFDVQVAPFALQPPRR